MKKIKAEDILSIGQKVGVVTVIEIKTSSILIEYPENFNDGNTQGTITKRKYIGKDEFLEVYKDMLDIAEQENKELSELSVEEIRNLVLTGSIDIKGEATSEQEVLEAAQKILDEVEPATEPKQEPQSEEEAEAASKSIAEQLEATQPEAPGEQNEAPMKEV